MNSHDRKLVMAVGRGDLDKVRRALLEADAAGQYVNPQIALALLDVVPGASEPAPKRGRPIVAKDHERMLLEGRYIVDAIKAASYGDKNTALENAASELGLTVATAQRRRFMFTKIVKQSTDTHVIYPLLELPKTTDSIRARIAQLAEDDGPDD